MRFVDLVSGLQFSSADPRPELGRAAADAGAPRRTGLDRTVRSSAPRRLLGLLVIVAHAVALYVVTQGGRVREAVRAPSPVYAVLISPVAFEPQGVPVQPPPARARMRPPTATPAVSFAAATPNQSPPASLVSEASPLAGASLETPTEAAVVASSEVPSPAVGTPRTVAATDVEYLEAPRVTYPALSRRLGEQGRVILRVLVDLAGRPAQVLVANSSGYARLDEAAVQAAHGARFRSYTENGQPQRVWVLLPFVFSLEKSG